MESGRGRGGRAPQTPNQGGIRGFEVPDPPPSCASSADGDGEIGVAGPPPGAGLGRGVRPQPLQVRGPGGPPAQQGGHAAAAAALSPLSRAQERWVRPVGAWRVLCAPPPVLTPPPQISSRLQLCPDGAPGGGRGSRAAPRRLRRALPPAAAAGSGEPQQEAVSGDPLRPPRSPPGPPRVGGTPPAHMQIKGAALERVSEGAGGTPPLFRTQGGHRLGPPKWGRPPGGPPRNLPFKWCGSFKRGGGGVGGQRGGVASDNAGGVAYLCSASDWLSFAFPCLSIIALTPDWWSRHAPPARRVVIIPPLRQTRLVACTSIWGAAPASSNPIGWCHQNFRGRCQATSSAFSLATVKSVL